MDKNEFVSRIEGVKKQLYRTAYLYLNNEASALEAVDESVYRAFKELKSLREPDYFNTWVTRILINECYKELRRVKRITLEDTMPEGKMEDYNLDHYSLKEAIRYLPEDYRNIVILRYFIGFTLAETAAALDIPQGTVVTRQRKALALLKIELREEKSV